jgi:HPr kinase/phosphorylase
VAVDGRGLLILGASGAGKSALALRMMALGARLVADDRVLVKRRGAVLIAYAPPVLRGVIEARGIGLLKAEALDEAPLALAVDLDRPAAARMPQPREIAYHDLSIELIFGQQISSLEVILVQLLRCGRAGPFV